jgi:uncharacterized protein
VVRTCFSAQVFAAFFLFLQFFLPLCGGNFFRAVSVPTKHAKAPQDRRAFRVEPELQFCYGSLWDKYEIKSHSLDLVLKASKKRPSKSIHLVLQTEDGIERNAVLTLREGAKGNVIMCHPAAYDKNFMIPYKNTVFAHYNCLYFDFRRHGEHSRKQYSTLGRKEIYEVFAAINLLKERKETKDLPTFGFGVSLGASVLLRAEAERPHFKGLVLQAPFESLRKQIKRTFPAFQKPILKRFIFRQPIRTYAKLKYRLDLRAVKPIDAIRKIRTPIFLIHAQDDPVIPFEAFVALRKAGKSIVQTWTPPIGRHTELFMTYPDLYTRRCNSFLNRVLLSGNTKRRST